MSDDPSEKPSKDKPTYRFENGTLIVTGPKEMSYTEGRPIPPGYHLEEQMRRGLAIAGIVTLGGAYLLSLGSVAVVEDEGSTVLLIPIAGPFLALETTDTKNDEVAKAILIFDGAAQAIGAAMMIAGFVTSSTKLVRNDQSWTVFPTAGKGFAGLGVAGAL